MSALLELHHLTIQYPGTSKKVIQDLSFSLAEGEIACLLGPSGCGKTSVLRAIAGFLQPNSGEIRVKGQSVNSYNTWVAPEKRGIGVVFQDYALFPHLTVGKNIGFGLTELTPPQREKRVAAMLDLVG
ncbi:MAG: ABC transporter ATP-binding protein, partial [Burkholderiales bacterium]|nr:ABC transporter ATP-binding protein [Burkholderiales bacterium]